MDVRGPPAHLGAVAGLLVHHGDVLPTEGRHQLRHRHRLEVVAGDGPREVLEPLLVRQLGGRGEKGDLEIA